MRKKVVFIIAVILAFASLFLLASCNFNPSVTEKKVKSVTVVSEREEAYVIGEDSSLSGIFIKIRYTDGTVESVPADEYMLDEDNRAKFYEKGVHTVCFSYKEYQAHLQITVVAPEIEVSYLATFYSNGGSDVANQKTPVIKAFVNPSRENYEFAGWYVNPDFTGNKAVAPYTLKADTVFYAKWIDNRRCNVKFMDGDEVFYDFEVVYGTGIDIRDMQAYPAPSEKPGKIFTGWTLASGSNLDEITADTVIAAAYESVKCVVNIEFASDSGITFNPYTFNYGDVFDLSNFRLPTKEGYITRWVLYRGDSEEFEEIYDSQIIITDEKLTIRPYHVIETYNVIIFNGKPEEEQTHEDLKSGNVAVHQVYSDETTKVGFKVEYNSDFNLSLYNQEINLVAPQAIKGYFVEWCYVVTGADGEEIWYNKEHKVWSDTEKAFVGDFTTNFSLYDRRGNYIARVENGDVKEIKGDVLIRAKYWKRTYNVTLYRKETNGWDSIKDEENVSITFQKEYLSDFCLYDPEEYDGKFDNAEPADIEFYYHKNNVPRWTMEDDISNLWKTIYFNGDRDDDYDIKWYTRATSYDSDRFDFLVGNELRYFEITDNLQLYCEDIDLRGYTVILRYGYNFETGDYDKRKEYSEIGEKVAIDLPDNYGAAITRTFPNGKTAQYVFDGWYDYPYVPEDYGYPYSTAGNNYPFLDGNEDLYGYPYGPNGVYGGTKSDDFIYGRTKNVFYYAHYRCDARYALNIYDKTQLGAFSDIDGYDGAYYDVSEGSVSYVVPVGTTLYLDMIYKGRANDNGAISGQVYYERVAFINYFDGEFTDKYNALIEKYGEGTFDFATAKVNLMAELREKQSVADEYNLLLARIYNYDFAAHDDYAEITKEYFLDTFMSLDEYYALCREIHTLEGNYEILESYQAKKIMRDQYCAENEAESGNGGLYKRYLDSVRDLNNAYGYDVEVDEHGNILSDEYKYKFVGWYSDATYSTLYSQTFEFEWFAWNDLDLYAKWADEEKGTEGLVFRKVLDENGEDALVVVDFMNRTEYEKSDIYGCGFNQFSETNEYSINLNDQDVMPAYLGKDIDVQIPKTHGGTNGKPLTVIGILAEAFARHGQEIRTVSLPNTIQFVEENAFVRCNLVSVTYNGNEEDGISSDVDGHVLYQNLPYSYTVGGELRTANGNVLILFANRNNLDSYKIKNGTERIADNAFYLAEKLTVVTLNDGLKSIGKNAFASSGITGVLTLPDTVTEIEDTAFANCDLLSDIGISENSQLCYVGPNAFISTGWYMNKIGIIAINGILIGIRSADSHSFDREEEGDYVYTTINGITAYSFTNDYGVIYYGADGNAIKIIVNSNINRIASLSFGGTGGALNEVEIDGAVADGIDGEAFKNCSSLQKVTLKDIDAECKVAWNAFIYCMPITVYVTDAETVDSSWESCLNVTLENI